MWIISHLFGMKDMSVSWIAIVINKYYYYVGGPNLKVVSLFRSGYRPPYEAH
jgi:hypothetical protein